MPLSSKLWQQIGHALGWALALGGLVWVFHDANFPQLKNGLSKIHWNWVAAAVAFDLVAYVAQAWRWNLLLRPVGAPQLRHSVQAIFVGLFANEILPLRVGELARAYLVSQRTKLEFSLVLSSLALERLFDGLWLALGFGITAMLVPMPHYLLEAGDILGWISVIAVALFFVMLSVSRRAAARARSQTEQAPARLKFFQHLFGRLLHGLGKIGTSSSFYLSFLASFVFLLLEVLAVWAMMHSYELPLSFWVAAAVFLIIHLGTAIPNAPANVGSYQFFCVIGLTLFGVEKTTATGFSVVLFVCLTIPLLILGALALGSSGFSLRSLRNRVSEMMLKSKMARVD